MAFDGKSCRQDRTLLVRFRLCAVGRMRKFCRLTPKRSFAVWTSDPELFVEISTVQLEFLLAD
jgi:hypothetical protein